MNVDDLTLGQIKELQKLLMSNDKQSDCGLNNPYIGRRVLVRTYSAGVHIGTLVAANGAECELKDALRLWKWESGGLSLSAVATNGIVKARLNKTGCVFLTNAIEYIPTTETAEESYVKFIED